jgi:hypothetical protein
VRIQPHRLFRLPCVAKAGIEQKDREVRDASTTQSTAHVKRAFRSGTGSLLILSLTQQLSCDAKEEPDDFDACWEARNVGPDALDPGLLEVLT